MSEQYCEICGSLLVQDDEGKWYCECNLGHGTVDGGINPPPMPEPPPKPVTQ